MKVNIANEQTNPPFNKKNFPPGTYFKFMGRVWIALDWCGNSVKVVPLDDPTPYEEFTEDNADGYIKLDIKSIDITLN